MTYTFKLARRLAVSRDFVVITALLLLAGCMGDSTAPEADPSSSSNNIGSLHVLPRSVNIETNQRVQFRGQVRSSRGELVGMPIAWGANGGIINSDGTFSSATSGTFKVIGRGRGWKQTDTSVVTVVTPPTNLARIVVTPDSVTLDAGAKRTFSVTGYLDDGSTATIGVYWSATGGAVDPAGVYTADSKSGVYRVIATNTAGTLADTAKVTINAPPPPPLPTTLTSVVLSPVNVSLAVGSTKQFKAYGRNSAGDSVAVSAAFNATGGTITSGGLYTAGQTAGTYHVIATSSGLSDTAVVTLTKTSTSASGEVGIPFGPARLWRSTTSTESVGTSAFTSSIAGTSAGGIVTLLNAARGIHQRLVLNMTGGAHDLYLTDGVFDMAKWKARMDTYNSATIRSAVAAAVADGTLIGNSVMDEPNVHGLGDGNTWGPVGTMTKARVDSMCSYVKAIFPTLPVGVVHSHQAFEPTKSYKVCEFIVDAYSSRYGSVVAFRDAALALAARDGISILFSMNILNGGIQAARDGLWNCSLTTTGGRGTYDPNCRMTAQQVRENGLVLGPAGCGMLMWRYDLVFMGDPENQQAFKDVAARLATLPRKSCGRQ